jgi:pyrroline-5-carboxylate reductase
MPLGKTIAFLGAGNMAEALVKGMLRAGVAMPGEILLTDRRKERLSELETRYGVRTSTDNRDAAAQASIIVLSVKPQVMNKLLAEIAPSLDGKKLVISIAAGVPLAAVERRVGHGVRIIRTMPNTPALVGAGATAISAGEHATQEDMDQAKLLFDAVGKTVVVDETLLDAVTGLSGSGPAYVFLMIEALADAGVKMGLDRRNSQDLAAQTVLGSAQLLLETGEHPGKLKDQVTSPGGTAIAGLHTLEAGGLRTTLMNAVEAATQRAHELGRRFLEAKDEED